MKVLLHRFTISWTLSFSSPGWPVPGYLGQLNSFNSWPHYFTRQISIGFNNYDSHVCISPTVLKTWLRVSQGLHTINQAVVGAAVGSIFSILWFWSWDAFVQKAFISSLWVRMVVVMGAAVFCLAFLVYVIGYWFNDDWWIFLKDIWIWLHDLQAILSEQSRISWPEIDSLVKELSSTKFESKRVAKKKCFWFFFLAI